MKKRIPFVPFSLEKTLNLSKNFLWLSNYIIKFFPRLDQNLLQADMKIRSREYLSIAIFSSIFWFFLIFLILLPISFKIAFLLGIFFLFLTFNYILFYPKLLIHRKNRDVERNLIFVVKHLLVQVKSGVSLFDAMVSVAKENYGEISKDFEICVKQISTGKDQIEALEEMVLRNPNFSFRRVIWQIINTLRTGSDLSTSLLSISNELTNEQAIKIRKYGSQLAPLALMYLIITIILPTLGTNFIVVFSSFGGISLPPAFFILIIFVVALFQFTFLGMIKNRRPSVEI